MKMDLELSPLGSANAVCNVLSVFSRLNNCVDCQKSFKICMSCMCIYCQFVTSMK